MLSNCVKKYIICFYPVFRVVQIVFVPHFYIALIWQLFFFFLWIFSSYAKELMHMISRKKKIVYLIPFHKTEFSNSFCQRFFYPVFSPIVKILQFYFNSAHILPISPTHEVTLLTKFHNDCAKIVEFLLVASFGLSPVFFCPSL